MKSDESSINSCGKTIVPCHEKLERFLKPFQVSWDIYGVNTHFITPGG
jgi:hypothetical protein